MTTRLIISLDRAPAKARNLVTQTLKDSSVGWWHWLQHLWLVVDPEGRDAAWWRNHLRDQLQVAAPRVLIFVSDADTGYWAIRGPKRSFVWLQETWEKHEPKRSYLLEQHPDPEFERG
jgi:hypothetical protein